MTSAKLHDGHIQFTYVTPVTCACDRLTGDAAAGGHDQQTSYPSYDVYDHVNYWHLEGTPAGYVSGEQQLPPESSQQATVATVTPQPMSFSSDSLDENSKTVLPTGDEDDHSKSMISREASGDSSSDFPESAVPPPTKTMSYPVPTTASSDLGSPASTSDGGDDNSEEPFSEENEDKHMISTDEEREKLSFDAINRAREITFHRTITKGRQSTSAAVISQTRDSTSSDEGRRYSSITALYLRPTRIKRSMQNLLDQAARCKRQSAKQNSHIPKRLCSVCGHTKKRVHLTSAQIARAKCIINNTLTECNTTTEPASLNEPSANQADACQYGTQRRKKKQHMTSAQIARAKYIIDNTLTEPNTAMPSDFLNESNTNQTRTCQYGTNRRKKKKLHMTSAQIARAKYIIDNTLTEPNTAMPSDFLNESNTNQTRTCQYGTNRRKKKKLHMTSAQIARAKYIIDTLNEEAREEMLHHLYGREDFLADGSQTEEQQDRSIASPLETAPRTGLDKATIAEMLRYLDSQGDLVHEHRSTLPRLSRHDGSAQEHINTTRTRHMSTTSKGTTMMTRCKYSSVDINRKVLDSATFGTQNTQTNDETALQRGHTQSHAWGGQFLYSQRDHVIPLAESKYEEIPDNTGNRAIVSLALKSAVNATAGETSAELSSDEFGGCTRTGCIESNIHDAESDTSLSSVVNPGIEYGLCMEEGSSALDESIQQKGLNTTTTKSRVGESHGIGKVHVYFTPDHRRTSITNRKNDTAFSYSKRDHLIRLAEPMQYKQRIADESSQSEDSVGATESKATMISSSVDSNTSYDFFGEDNALSTMDDFSKIVSENNTAKSTNDHVLVRSTSTKSPALTVVTSTQAPLNHHLQQNRERQVNIMAKKREPYQARLPQKNLPESCE